MKRNIILIITVIFFSTQFLLAQEVPVPPKPPKINFHSFFKMNENDEKELLKNLKDDLKKELEVIKSVNKERYYNFLRESQFKNMKIPFFEKREKAMYEREKAIFEAEIKAEAIAAKYLKAKETEKRKLRNKLKEKLNTLFEQKEKRRKEEVEKLEQELHELRKSLLIRQQNKKEIIERRIKELLDEDEYLDWD